MYESAPIRIIKVKDGENGSDGMGIKSTSCTYQAGASGTAAPTGTWLSYIPEVSDGQYLWTRTVITYTDGTKSTSYSVGKMGENGQSQYFHVKYSDDGESFTTNNGETLGAWMGTCVDSSATDPTAFNAYTWRKIVGEDGKSGIDGIDGTDGLSSYFYVKFSANANGNPMTETPNSNTKYMGVCSTTSPTAPTSYSAYKWTQCRGDDGIDGKDGIPGEPGADGISQYFHVKYSDDGKNFTSNDGETLGKWMGTCVNAYEPDPTDFDAYTWRKIVGEDGMNGIDGVDGTDGESSYFFVKFSENPDGNPMTETPTSDTKYMGVCSTTSPVAPTDPSAYKWTQCRGEDGSDGTPGLNGKTSYLHIKYSDDGQTFTDDNGEMLGAWIGTLVDFNPDDSENFDDYTWKKFTEDVDDEIEALDGSIQVIRENISQLVVNEDQIKSSVSALVGIVNSTNGEIQQTREQISSVEQTAGQIQLKIETINNNGVTKVRNTTGTFNEYGLDVDSTNSATKTQVTPDGMVVYKKGSGSEQSEVLTATSAGVDATNLHAKTYLIVGGRSRFENYGADRTGCFWIGG